MPMQDPGCDHDQIATADLVRARLVRPDRFAHDQVGGGEQAQRLVQYGAGAGIGVIGQFLLFVGVLRQERESPEQRHRRGLVPREDQRRHLVAQLIGAEAGAGFRVAGGAQQIEQIARLLRRFGSQAVAHDRLDQWHPALLEPAAAEIARRRNRRRQQQIEHAGPGMLLPVFRQHPAHFGTVTRHFEGEHRPAGDLQSQILHCLQQVDRTSDAVLQRVQRLMGGRDDVARQQRHHTRRQRGRDGAALQFPDVALGQ